MARTWPPRDPDDDDDDDDDDPEDRYKGCDHCWDKVWDPDGEGDWAWDEYYCSQCSRRMVPCWPDDEVKDHETREEVVEDLEPNSVKEYPPQLSPGSPPFPCISSEWGETPSSSCW